MIKRNIFIILVMLAVMAGMTLNVWAVEEGSYIISNKTHYVNPDTEVSDDGGDVSIGEGMCRNTVYPQSYYEFKDGKHYVTLRIKMISFIENIRIKVQTEKGNENSYKAVEYTAAGQNTEENTKDFHFEIPAADVLIKPTFFVGPMNRDVTFFVSLDMETAKKDDGEFSSFNETESVEDESTTAEEDNIEEDNIIEETESESDIKPTMAVDEEKNKSPGTALEPSNELQPSQDMTPKDNTTPINENTQGDEEGSDSNSDPAHTGEDSNSSSAALADTEKDSVEEKAEPDNVESEQVIANNDNFISLNEEKSEETVGITEFNEEGVEKLPEKEKDSSTSRVPIISAVIILGIGVFLIYSKKVVK